MTGLYEPTQGEIEMFGINMHEEFEYCRKFMGVCPQHDVLFELLTPQEHMEIFYDFKCEDRDPVKKRIEIAKLLKDLGVADKKNDLAGQLSGGNQRKLSVGLALCGGSKFVVFDEPTAGMDLSARRQTWTALREYKKDRIILLTTHYMDEADILGDRIGIMSAGSLVCLGSSMFLKRKYGVGYNMTMLKTSKEPNDLVMPYFVRKLGPECKKISEIQSEITLQIPKEYSDKFKKFFSQFDHDLEKL
jgi:ATP-binding cassette subfamily A (ABC1) protein 3